MRRKLMLNNNSKKRKLISILIVSYCNLSSYQVFQPLSFLSKASLSLPSLPQWAVALLKCQPMSEKRVSGAMEALNTVFALCTKLNTLLLSAFEAGMARSPKAKVAGRTYMCILQFLD